MVNLKRRRVYLKEDNNKNYAADTDSSNATPSELVNQTKREHSDADSVTIPGQEIDGNTQTQVSTVNIDNTPQSLNNAQKMARTFQQQGQDVNFKVNLHNGYKPQGTPIVEGVTFTKRELSNFLRSI
jgi:hypothetical protein